jgi:hypothetical protein
MNVAVNSTARLLDLVPGRSAAALATWLAARTPAFREQVQIVAMDGFGGYQTAATGAVPGRGHRHGPVSRGGVGRDQAGPVPPAHIQQDTTGHRGRAGDPLYRVRRTLRTRTALLPTRQKTRLETVFADDAHLPVEVTWLAYQHIAAARPPTGRGMTRSLGRCRAMRSSLRQLDIAAAQAVIMAIFVGSDGKVMRVRI